MHQKKGQINPQELTKLVGQPLSKDEWWHLVDKKWYDKCLEYLASSDVVNHPGPIDNSALFEPINNAISSPFKTSSSVSIFGKSSAILNGAFDDGISSTTSPNSAVPGMPVAAVAIGSRPLKKDIEENEDFIVVPREAWEMLVNEYGLIDPSHSIKRKVIEDAPNHLIVEVYPVSLKLCLYGPKESTVEKQFSRTTPLKEVEEEMRKLFMVNPNLQTQLWATTPSGTNTVFKATASSSNLEDTENNAATANVPTPPPMPTSFSNAIPLPALSAPSTSIVTRSVSSSITGNNSLSRLITDATSTSNVTPKENSLSQTLQDAGLSSNSVLTLEVANADGTWPSSKPRLGAITRSSKATPGLCGLSNMGNTCFMNAALQCLSNTPQLTNYILSDKFVNDINVDNPLGMRGEIARTYADLIKNIWSGSFTSFMPRDFKCAVGRFAPQFNGFQQQDCQELMAFLLDGLHEDLNRIKDKPYIEIKTDIDRRPDEVVAAESWSNYLRRNDSIVVDTFHALLKSTLVCPECELVSVTFDPFCYLSLPLQVKREKQIDLVFVPAPRPLDANSSHDVNGHPTSTNERSEEAPNYMTDELIGPAIRLYDGADESRLQPVQISKFSIPKSGPISEVCDSVARAINESKCYGISYNVDPNNLIVAELYNNKVSRVYESAEHYTRFGDEFIIYERVDKYCIPFYVRERKNESSSAATVLGSVRVIHVPDTNYKTIYNAIYKQLFNNDQISESPAPDSTALNVGSEAEMDGVDHEPEHNCDDQAVSTSNEMDHDSIQQSEAPNCQQTLSPASSSSSSSSNNVGVCGEMNGKSASTSKLDLSTEAFKISVVNSNGSSTVSSPQQDGQIAYSSRLYLAADMLPSMLNRPEFKHLKRPHDNNNIINLFDTARALNIQRVGPKPTLKLQDCISQFTNVERLGADDPWYCPKCKKHQQATKKFDIWSLPNVLIIHLKRFSFSRSWRDKIDTLVDFPITGLDMSDHVLSPEQRANSSMVYDLIGVANHFGGLGGGHYTAHAKNAPLGTWHYFDDTLVSPASLDTVVSRNGYVLFYQRRDQI